MSSATPKDHYVPQFYLDDFSIEGPDNKDPHIYQYMKDKIVPARIKDVASEKHFYTFKNKETGEPNREIDDFFTKIESNASSPLKKIIKGETLDLTDQEFEHLSIFFAVLAVRTPGFIKAQESFAGEAIKEFYALDSMNKEKLKKRYDEVGIAFTDQELDEQQKFILEKNYTVSFNDSRAYFLGNGLKVACELAEWYYQRKHWHLIISDSPTVFVTSDNPISIYRPIYVPPVQNAGYGNGTLLIPISPKYALLLRDLPLKQKIIKLSSQKIININKNTMQFSDNYIFSNLESKKIFDLYKSVGNKKFQKTNVTRMTRAPYVFMGPPQVPKEFLY